MKVKLTRNLGLGLIKELGLDAEQRYEENGEHDVSDEAAKKLLDANLAEAVAAKKKEPVAPPK